MSKEKFKEFEFNERHFQRIVEDFQNMFSNTCCKLRTGSQNRINNWADVSECQEVILSIFCFNLQNFMS